ncbi:MAG: flagellar basal body P-ring protein FlgI [Sedimentisphaerales bacterium]
MNMFYRKIIWLTVVLLIACFANGCGKRFRATGRSETFAPVTELGTTIGSLAEVVMPELVAVEGYGLVGGLNGTGSAECPPQIRTYLRQYILTQLPERKLDVEKFINSLDTAVVRVEGIIPTAALKHQYFDVRVVALPGTQTISLEDGWLYRAELKAKGTFGISTRVVANAEGPIFIDKIGTSTPDTRLGYILAGGSVLEEYKVNLVFHKQDYRIASLVRNRLDGRFGYGIAKAVSPSRIELKVPAKYKGQKQRFADIVKAMYLDYGPEITQERIKTFVRKLAVSEDKYESEVALEAIGNESLSKLSILLNSSDEEVRLRAARCMLNLGSDQGLQALREIALDEGSAYRVEALEAITTAARRNDAAAISRKLLRDQDFDMRLAAYEQLRKLGDTAVTQRLVARSFYLEQIAPTKHQAVFVSRSGQPRIVLFGAPIRCRDNIFVQSSDGNITINAPPGQKYVSIIRRHPRRSDVILQVKSSFELADIILTLCEEPLKKDKQARHGLGISYADMIALLKQVCDKGAVAAEFRAGPLPKID